MQNVLNVVRQPAFRETGESRAMLQNLALEARVRSVLRQDPVTRNQRFAIHAVAGRVVLNGIVDSGREKRRISDLVYGVPGVKDLRNALIAADERHAHREG